MHSLKTKTKQMTLVGLMTAILCVLAPISIVLPISPIPISLGTLAIYFILMILDRKNGVTSIFLYTLLGIVGLPVFSGFSGGIGRLMGPTGGFIIGYPLMALISSLFMDKYGRRIPICFIGMLLGTLACYSSGTIWLAYQANLSLPAALSAGVLPFIPGDIVKLLCGIFIGYQVRTQLKKAALL